MAAVHFENDYWRIYRTAPLQVRFKIFDILDSFQWELAFLLRILVPVFSFAFEISGIIHEAITTCRFHYAL